MRRKISVSSVTRVGLCLGVAVAAFIAASAVPRAQSGYNAIANPYRLVENWAQLPSGQAWGAVIGIIPDGNGGTWVHHRSNPPILHFDASGTVVKSFGTGMFRQAHGFCMDRDGNLWAGDSPFSDNADDRGKGFQFFKFTQDGQLLLTLGKAGVARAGEDTFLGPTACTIAPNGDIVIADGHYPRPSYAQQDGDRIVRFTTDGTFVGAWGTQGSGPGEFWGPHALAFDSTGRLFVADRSNNRIQIFDKDMNFIDDWQHFGRPSGLWILKDDTLLVADSESSRGKDPKTGTSRNPGWKNGIRIGSAKDGSLKYYINGTMPEGLAADEHGNIFAGMTVNPILQKWVMK